MEVAQKTLHRRLCQLENTTGHAGFCKSAHRVTEMPEFFGAV